jgi:pyruvate/2-oxoglutarate dehydrogenase complex dihydrolipoamide acyltransferase (E2) component
VIDELRRFLNAPLRDADRPRLFALAVGLIVAVAAVLALLDDAGPAPERSRSAAPAAAPVAVSPAAEEEAEPAAPSKPDVRQAKRVARRFLAGYLRYSYGRGGASSIEGASTELRERLAEARPRVPAAQRRRRPRVVLLQTEGASVTALVDDGAQRYTVGLELAGGQVVDVAG